MRTLTLDRGDIGKRLDLVVRRHLTDVTAATRTRIQRWIARGAVAVNGTPVHRASTRVGPHHVVTVLVPESAQKRRMAPEEVQLDVLYEDEHLLAINKPAGLVVHPTHRHATGTLMNALLWYARAWTPPQRPSILGRLDRLTSGIVLVAKTAPAHAALQRELGSPRCRKDYLALVYGRTRARGTIDWRLERDHRDRRKVAASRTRGAESLTEFQRLAASTGPRRGLSLVRCRLITGRTHQIRVHLAAEGWPIVGDPVYGEPRWEMISDASLSDRLETFPRQALHAWRIAFTNPIVSRRVAIEAQVPEEMQALLKAAGVEYS